MAKKRTEPNPVSPPEPASRVLSVRGSGGWHGWLARLADHDRSSLADLVDHALVSYAREIGFKELPPKR
jgi:hypothetical protein